MNIDYREDEPQNIPIKTGINKDWRKSNNPEEIIKLFPFRPEADDIMDLYEKNKIIKSNKLNNFLKMVASRLKENKNNMNKKFNINNLITECITEVIQEKKQQNRNTVTQLIKESVKEVVEEKKKDKKNKPVVGYDGKGVFTRKNGDEDTHKKMRDELEKIAKKIDRSIEVFWDDHKDLIVWAKDKFKVTINEKYDNNFDVTAMLRGTDRIKVTGINFDQVKEFIKDNFPKETPKTYVDKEHGRVEDNMKDQTGKKPKDIPKTEEVKQKEVGKKEKEDAVKSKDDAQDAEFREVEKPKRQEDHGVEKSPKKVSQKSTKSDDTLVINLKK